MCGNAARFFRINFAWTERQRGSFAFCYANKSVANSIYMCINVVYGDRNKHRFRSLHFQQYHGSSALNKGMCSSNQTHLMCTSSKLESVFQLKIYLKTEWIRLVQPPPSSQLPSSWRVRDKTCNEMRGLCIPYWLPH